MALLKDLHGCGEEENPGRTQFIEGQSVGSGRNIGSPGFESSPGQLPAT